MAKRILPPLNKFKRDLLFSQILELCKKSNLPIQEIDFVLRMVYYKIKEQRGFEKV